VGVGDYNLDGHLDLYKTHFMEDSNGLFHNDGKSNFDDVTRPAGIAVETRYVCWGTGLVDLDNDGYPDIFVATGNVYPEVERKLPQYAYKTPRLVFRNLGNGTFEELDKQAGPGVVAPHCSRGCAFGDFDNDGDVDILVMNLNETPSLVRNDLKGNHNWIKIKLEVSEIQSQRDWSAGACALWRESAGASRFQPIEFLFLQRFPPALWARFFFHC
jgi:hypothetical protein